MIPGPGGGAKRTGAPGQARASPAELAGHLSKCSWGRRGLLHCTGMWCGQGAAHHHRAPAGWHTSLATTPATTPAMSPPTTLARCARWPHHRLLPRHHPGRGSSFGTRGRSPVQGTLRGSAAWTEQPFPPPELRPTHDPSATRASGSGTSLGPAVPRAVQMPAARAPGMDRKPRGAEPHLAVLGVLVAARISEIRERLRPPVTRAVPADVSWKVKFGVGRW